MLEIKTLVGWNNTLRKSATKGNGQRRYSELEQTSILKEGIKPMGDIWLTPAIMAWRYVVLPLLPKSIEKMMLRRNATTKVMPAITSAP